MKSRQDKSISILDYAIGILMIIILILATFLMPQGYSAFVDGKALNKVTAVERESFSFTNPVEMTVYERVQQMMEALKSKGAVSRTLYLTGQEVTDGDLLERIKEAIGIAIQYNMIPDISGYDIENNIVYAEYYNLSDSTAENAENAFWNIRFSDHATFDFMFRVDASEYIIYQAEIYCAEALEYVAQLMSFDVEVVSLLNNQFMEGSVAYFEAEGYSALTDVSSGDMILMLGYERGEYALYHTSGNNGYLGYEGLRWGFVPMTVVLEKGNAINEWGYRGIVSYYQDLYEIEIYEDNSTEIK